MEDLLLILLEPFGEVALEILQELVLAIGEMIIGLWDDTHPCKLFPKDGQRDWRTKLAKTALPFLSWREMNPRVFRGGP